MFKGLCVRVITIESEMEFNVAKDTTGEMLFSQVTKAVGLREIWYFGLQFTDSKGHSTWLKSKKKITSQDIPKTSPLELRLLIRFFPEDVEDDLIQDTTQRFFYLQVKKQIIEEELYCSPETCVLLASYAIQVKHGDYNEATMKNVDLSNVLSRTLPKKVLDTHDLSDEEWMSRISNWWKEHNGMLHEDAIMEYLKIVQDLEMYGVTYYPICNKKGTSLLLGVDAHGINIYEPDNKLTPKIGFPWSEINKVEYKRKTFMIRSTDKSTGPFTFTAPSRTNREILSLSVSNHDLYMKRRKTPSMEIQQMKAQAEEEKIRKRELRDKMKQEKLAREEVQMQLQQMAAKLERQSEQNTEIQEQLDQYKEKVRTLDELLAASNLQREDLKRMQDDLERNNRELEEARNNMSGDYAKLMDENERIRSEIEFKNAEVSESTAQLESRQEELDQLRREREELEEKARQLELQNTVREASIEDNDKDFAQELEVTENGDGDDKLENRVTAVAANVDLQAQLQSLAADLETKRTETSEMDKLHIGNQKAGRDKFKTLKQIRQGNTKRRIDQFESI